MMLVRLTLLNLRNYAELEFAPAAGLNVLVGPNAQGKSNLLEAIGLLGIGKSFRSARESELIRHGMPLASAVGEVGARAGRMRLSCRIAAAGTEGRSARKSFTLNGSPVRYAGYLGRLRVVTFVPAHLQLISGAPALRRNFINAALAQESPPYYAALAAYGRAQQQKGALLRGSALPDPELLAVYDERLVEAGTPIMLARHAYLRTIAERAATTYRTWAGPTDGPFAVRYLPNVEFETATADAVAAAFTARLRAVQPAEIARRGLLAGPHRDDVGFTLGEVPLDSFGSQGQQRTAVLALKVAEYAVMTARSGEAPILLLDDVLSELDADRQRAFLAGVESFEQAFVTTTAPIATARGTAFAVRAGTLAAA